MEGISSFPSPSWIAVGSMIGAHPSPILPFEQATKKSRKESSDQIIVLCIVGLLILINLMFYLND